jgi:hypothetical protein
LIVGAIFPLGRYHPSHDKQRTSSAKYTAIQLVNTTLHFNRAIASVPRPQRTPRATTTNNGPPSACHKVDPRFPQTSTFACNSQNLARTLHFAAPQRVFGGHHPPAPMIDGQMRSRSIPRAWSNRATYEIVAGFVALLLLVVFMQYACTGASDETLTL